MTSARRFRLSCPAGSLSMEAMWAAVATTLMARAGGGEIVVIIEDAEDAGDAALAAQARGDLRWLGLAEAAAALPLRRAESRETAVAAALRLLAEGQAYWCFCPPAELEERRRLAEAGGSSPRYDGRCAALPAAASAERAAREPAALRLRIAETTIDAEDLVRGPLRWDAFASGDFVVLRSDGMPMHDFHAAVDDGGLGITHVMHHEARLSDTLRQILVHRALGGRPPSFGSLPALLGRDHAHYGRRHGPSSVAELRRRGFVAEAVVAHLASLGGAEAPVLDAGELEARNGSALAALSTAELCELAFPFLTLAGYASENRSAAEREFFIRALGLLVPRPRLLADIPTALALLFEFSVAQLDDPHAGAVLDEPLAQRVLAALAVELERDPREVTSDVLRAWSAKISMRTAASGRQLIMPLRLAFTGRAAGPDLEELVDLLAAGARLALPRPFSSARQRAAQVLGCLGIFPPEIPEAPRK